MNAVLERETDTAEETRELVMAGYEQAMGGQCKDFNAVFDRLIRKYAIQN